MLNEKRKRWAIVYVNGRCVPEFDGAVVPPDGQVGSLQTRRPAVRIHVRSAVHFLVDFQWEVHHAIYR